MPLRFGINIMNAFDSALKLSCALLSGALLLTAYGVRAAAQGATEERLAGRSMIVFAPHRLPEAGKRALVIVLHGGLGNAKRIESAQSEHGLNMDAVAEKGGFVVAYLNGTPVTRFLGPDKLGWNAGGGCCGLPAKKGIDDIAFIRGAIDHLVEEYGIDRNRIFGIGHSNGAMMAQRLLCETGVLSAIVPVSGPLNLDRGNCSAARDKRVLAIHGAEDLNVPIVGGRGTKGLSGATFKSEVSSRRAFMEAGAFYEIDEVRGADHNLDHIDRVIQESEGQSIAEKAARFFGLLK